LKLRKSGSVQKITQYYDTLDCMWFRWRWKIFEFLGTGK